MMLKRGMQIPLFLYVLTEFNIVFFCWEMREMVVGMTLKLA